MRILKLLTATILLGGLAAAGFYTFLAPAGPLVVENAGCGCPSSAPDPFDKGLAYNFGALRGRCINSCVFRSPELRGNTGTGFLLTNVYDDNAFWTAKIRSRKLESVEILFQNFAAQINHVALLFRFSEPVELEEQAPIPGKAARKKLMRALVISPEGAPSVEGKYNLFDGMLGRYTFVFRAISLEEFAAHSSRHGFGVRSFPSRFGRPESARLLKLAVETAESESFHTVYQLLFNNCATTSIDLALAAKKSLRSPGWDFWDILDPLRGIPLQSRIGTLRSLEWWDVIGPGEKLLVKAHASPDK